MGKKGTKIMHQSNHYLPQKGKGKFAGKKKGGKAGGDVILIFSKREEKKGTKKRGESQIRAG